MGTSLHVCVFHPDPVASAGEKHVISAQPVRHGQTENPTVDGTNEWQEPSAWPKSLRLS